MPLPSDKTFSVAILILLVSLASGCASTGSIDNDPLENTNRAVTKFNLRTDKAVWAPVARGYTKALPKPVRNAVNNFFFNLWEPYTVANDLLQGQFKLAVQDSGRFIINTTLGLAGLSDVARAMGLPRRQEDFGQTLAVWGVPPGAHLVLPFFGARNLRDSFNLIPRFVYANGVTPDTSPADTAATLASVVDSRSQLLGLEEILQVQADKYLFLRESYRQRRAYLISNGSQSDATEDELLEQLLQDN